MNSEEEMRLKIRKIEALFGGSEFIGERDAAEAALKRIKETLANTIKTTPALEYNLHLIIIGQQNYSLPSVVVMNCARFGMHVKGIRLWW